MGSEKVYQGLGRDYWYYISGRAVSLLGDGITEVALAWWVLKTTNSPSLMSAVLVPAMSLRLFLLPLLGPVGDTFSRKKIMMTAEIIRFATACIVGLVIIFGLSSIPLIISLYLINAIGDALSDSVSSGTIAAIVSDHKVQSAYRVASIIMSSSQIISGLCAGIIVTCLGTGPAILVDASTFLFAFVAIACCAKNLGGSSRLVVSFAGWRNDMRSGLRLVVGLRLLVYISAMFFLMRFALGPVSVALPVLVQSDRAMPAWFLGLLHSSLAIGSISAGILHGRISKYLKSDHAVVIFFACFGVGFILLPLASTTVVPLIAMLFLGFSITAAQVDLNSQLALLLPARFRSRVWSVVNFIAMLAQPLGVAAVGPVIEKFGSRSVLTASGLCILLVAMLIPLIPGFSYFMRYPLSTANNEEFIRNNYPKALVDYECERESEFA